MKDFKTNPIKSKLKNFGLIYRNYNKKLNIKELIEYKNICKRNNVKLYISNNIKIALKLRLDGVYLPAFNTKTFFLNSAINKNFLIMGSAHNLIEINKKVKQGCKIIFLAPLFKTKKSNKFLNICRFNLLTLNKKISFIALGGINNKNYNKLKMLRAYGLSGISFFKKKPAYKRPVFKI